MAQIERFRDELHAGQWDEDLLRRRTAEGWRLAAVEWVRETHAGHPPVREEVPYGLQVSSDCRYLEVNPHEYGIMLAMFEMIVQDVSISEIATRLNQRGFLTRTQDRWTAPAVFQLLPRLIEAGQRTFGTAQWAELRRSWARPAAS